MPPRKSRSGLQVWKMVCDLRVKIHEVAEDFKDLQKAFHNYEVEKWEKKEKKKEKKKKEKELKKKKKPIVSNH